MALSGFIYKETNLDISFSPGPPAEKLPPPPIKVFKTQNGMKSGCWWETDSKPMAMCASSGMGVGPRLTSEMENSKIQMVDRNSSLAYTLLYCRS